MLTQAGREGGLFSQPISGFNAYFSLNGKCKYLAYFVNLKADRSMEFDDFESRPLDVSIKPIPGIR